MVKNWAFLRALADGEPYLLNGIDFWKNDWKDTGERITVRDPHYGQEFRFYVYTITDGQRTERFAAGEFSNCIWGIYIEQ